MFIEKEINGDSFSISSYSELTYEILMKRWRKKKSFKLVELES